MAISHKPLFFLFTILSALRAHSSLGDFSCNHKQHFEHQFLEVEDKDNIPSFHQGRRLQSDITYPNIRISAHFDYLIASSPSSYAAYIQNELVPPVIDYYQAALKVKYPINGNLKLGTTPTSLCGQPVPSILQTTGVPADYFIIFDSVQQNGTTVAASNFCLLSTWTKRPLIARTVFTRNLLVEAKGEVLVHEKNMYVLMHEMMHTLGFSSDLFVYFIDENATQRRGHIKRRVIGGLNYTVIDVPPLTGKIRNFFGCTSLEGAIMENNGADGSANSHLERRFFLYEVMSPSGIDGRRVSELSLSMLEGSGWYVPDYNYSEPYHYGIGQGCGFIEGVCLNGTSGFDEFCTGTAKGCAVTGRSGGYCTSDTFSDGCKYYMPNKIFDCENGTAGTGAVLASMQTYGRGTGSKCFAGNINTKKSSTRSTYCFKYNCVGTGLSAQLEVMVGTNKVVCDKESQKTVKGLYGTIDCPDPIQFCSTVGRQYCPRNCLGRGVCVDNKCQCNKGFTGVDCALIDATA